MAILYGYEVYPDQKLTTKLSMAVWLKDDYTGKAPIGSAAVFLVGQEKKSIKNPSGYYLFLDLPNGEYQVRVEAEHYFAVNTTVNLPDLDPLNPVVDITLIPGPSYPFLPGATLIRGMVQDSDENPIPGAEVEIAGKSMRTTTTEKGEFVLYFKGLTEEGLIEEGNKRFVKGNGDKTIHLKAAHASMEGSMDLTSGVEESKTTVLEGPIILSEP